MSVARVVRRSTFGKIVQSPRVHPTLSSRQYLKEFINTLGALQRCRKTFPSSRTEIGLES